MRTKETEKETGNVIKEGRISTFTATMCTHDVSRRRKNPQ
jgi:hypothetical protein